MTRPSISEHPYAQLIREKVCEVLWRQKHQALCDNLACFLEEEDFSTPSEFYSLDSDAFYRAYAEYCKGLYWSLHYLGFTFAPYMGTNILELVNDERQSL